jgi:hypothetical protein
MIFKNFLKIPSFLDDENSLHQSKQGIFLINLVNLQIYPIIVHSNFLRIQWKNKTHLCYGLFLLICKLLFEIQIFHIMGFFWFLVIMSFCNCIFLLTPKIPCVFFTKLCSFWHSWKNKFFKNLKYENLRK